MYSASLSQKAEAGLDYVWKDFWVWLLRPQVFASVIPVGLGIGVCSLLRSVQLHICSISHFWVYCTNTTTRGPGARAVYLKSTEVSEFLKDSYQVKKKEYWTRRHISIQSMLSPLFFLSQSLERVTMAFTRDTNKHPTSADLPSANSFILNREH